MNDEEFETLLKKPVSDLQPGPDLLSRIRRAATLQMAAPIPEQAKRHVPWIALSATAVAALAIWSAAAFLPSPSAPPPATHQQADGVSAALNAPTLRTDIDRAVRFVIEQLPLIASHE